MTKDDHHSTSMTCVLESQGLRQGSSYLESLDSEIPQSDSFIFAEPCTDSSNTMSESRANAYLGLKCGKTKQKCVDIYIKDESIKKASISLT